jgi:hypothetical protein
MIIMVRAQTRRTHARCSAGISDERFILRTTSSEFLISVL